MKKSNKIYLQDMQESMAIIKNTLKEAFTLYNDHKSLSERHYIKIEFDTGAFIIIKMFSPDDNFDNQVGMVSVNDKCTSVGTKCLISFAYNSDPANIDVLLEQVLLRYCGTLIPCLTKEWLQVKYNFDEPDPKRKYSEITIKGGDSLEKVMDNWIWYINQSLDYGKRTICSGAWNINIGTPEQTKLKFSLMIEIRSINGLDCYYCEGIQNMNRETDIVTDDGLRDYLYSFADYIKKLESYTLPNKKETVAIKFYVEED